MKRGRYVGELEHNARQESQRCKNRKKNYAQHGKKRVISHERTVRVKVICSKAAVQNHEKGLLLFKTMTNGLQSFLV